jgi:carbonic anhydrase
MARSQYPFAIILGCSDSRVPAELVFDQGLGDLFVIRVAGNIVAPSQIGSVEFAAATFGTQLVVVLGHSNCGVIQASVDQLRKAPGLESRSLSSIVDRVTPGLLPLMTVYAGDDHALISAATRTNVLASVDQLRAGSEILGKLADEGKLVIVGAHYSLETGEVDFFS